MHTASPPKIAIIGLPQHGKTFAANLVAALWDLKHYAFDYYVAETLMYPLLHDAYKYTNIPECYHDRVNHTKVWKDAIADHGHMELMMGYLQRCDVFTHAQTSDDLRILKDNGLLDMVFWVDASSRLHSTPNNTYDLSITDANYVIDNNGPLEWLPNRVDDVLLDAYFQVRNKLRSL